MLCLIVVTQHERCVKLQISICPSTVLEDQVRRSDPNITPDYMSNDMRNTVAAIYCTSTTGTVYAVIAL
jgi:hypothetical protein